MKLLSFIFLINMIARTNLLAMKKYDGYKNIVSKQYSYLSYSNLRTPLVSVFGNKRVYGISKNILCKHTSLIS